MALKKTNTLPDNEKTFEINIEKGDTTGQRWTGTFRCICVQNLRQKAESDLLRTRLNGDLANISQDTLFYNGVISQLSSRLIAAPDWWIEANNGRDLMDLNVLFEVYKQAMEAEKAWRTLVWGESEENKDILKSPLKSTDTEAAEAEKEKAKPE